MIRPDASFTPRELFARMQGAWFEPRLGSMWQENTGATPTTAGGQTIGKLADLSGRGYDAVQATAANRPLLGRRYNLLTYSEDFSNSAWNGRSTGGNSIGVKTPNYGIAPDGTQTACRIQLDASAGANGTYSYIEISYLPDNGLYTQSCWIKTTDGSTKTIRNLTVQGEIVAVTGEWTKLIDSNRQLSDPIYNFQFLVEKGATSSVVDLLVWHPDVRRSSDVGIIPTYQRITTATDYDVGQYPAIRHADSTDVLTASLPAINVRRNLLNYSGDFTQKWELFLVTQIPASIYPGASTITETSDYYPHYVDNRTYTVPAGSTVTGTLWFQPGARRYIKLSLTDGIARNGWVTVDTVAKAVTYRSLASEATYAVSGDLTLDGDWLKLTCTIKLSDELTNVGLVLYGAVSPDYPAIVEGYVGVSTSPMIHVRGAQLELGSVATDYQKITNWTSEQYSSAGSVYFATPQGMSALHNQSIGTSYNLPALNTDIYGTVITPARLVPPLEQRLALYMHRLAGLADADFFWQETANDGLEGQLLADDNDTILLRA